MKGKLLRMFSLKTQQNFNLLGGIFLMYKYKYEKVICDFSNLAFGLNNIYSIEDYRQIINNRVANVWRYICYIPTKQRRTGYIQELDLIFETEV